MISRLISQISLGPLNVPILNRQREAHIPALERVAKHLEISLVDLVQPMDLFTAKLLKVQLGQAVLTQVPRPVGIPPLSLETSVELHQRLELGLLLVNGLEAQDVVKVDAARVAEVGHGAPVDVKVGRTGNTKFLRKK